MPHTHCCYHLLYIVVLHLLLQPYLLTLVFVVVLLFPIYPLHYIPLYYIIYYLLLLHSGLGLRLHYIYIVRPRRLLFTLLHIADLLLHIHYSIATGPHVVIVIVFYPTGWGFTFAH